LVESDLRKAVFLREATRGILNVTVIAKRAEECKPSYNWVVSRAVSAGEVLKMGLAPKAALLVSEQDALTAFEVQRVPWGDRRVVGMFHVEQ
jgi:16S rRNA G527 N7-methylase RsmG